MVESSDDPNLPRSGKSSPVRPSAPAVLRLRKFGISRLKHYFFSLLFFFFFFGGEGGGGAQFCTHNVYCHLSGFLRMLICLKKKS